MKADVAYRNVDADMARLRTLGRSAGVSEGALTILARSFHSRGVSAVSRQRASCRGTYDYSQRLGAVRNQDSVGWCYAFATADILSDKTGRKISGAGVAVSYNDYWRWAYNLFQEDCGEGKAGWGGNETTAISILRGSRGLCLESEFPSEDNGNGKILDRLTALERARRSQNRDRIVACAQDVFPNIAQRDILDVLRTSSQQELVKNLSDRACVHRVPMPSVTARNYRHLFNSADTLMSKIDAEITHGRLASMGYTASMLYNIDTVTRDGGHSSVIVGRKWDARKNECVYLVRNSYGPGCRQYDRRLECTRGQIWVPRSVLSKGIVDVTTYH